MLLNVSRRKAILGLAVALTVASAHGPSLAGESPAPFALTAQLQEADFSGVVLVKDGERVLYQSALGLADRAFGTPVHTDTRFRVASITKLFTAVTVLRLVEDGQLTLDDPFVRYLPDYPGTGAEHITLRQLLGHMSGLPQLDTVATLDDALRDGLPNYQRSRSPRQLLELCCAAAPVAAPGARFDYNNADYIVLGQVIEAVTGEPYRTTLRRLVLDPLGLNDTDLPTWSETTPRLAPTYFRIPGASEFINGLPFYWENAYAAGGLYSTIDDLDTFSDAVFAGGFLSPSSLEALLTPAGDEYGLGLWSYDFTRAGQRYRVAKRPGSIMGANAMLYRLVDRDVSVIILANSNAADLDQVAQDVAEAVLDGRGIQ